MIGAKYFSLMREGRLVFMGHFSQQEQSLHVRSKLKGNTVLSPGKTTSESHQVLFVSDEVL